MRNSGIATLLAKTVGRLLPICVLSLSLSAPSFAATLTIELDQHFGDVAAGTLTVELIDISASTVRLNMTSNDMGLADITGVYLNIGDTIDPTDLSFAYLGSSAPAATSIINDPVAGPSGDYKADGDGFYDMVFGWDNDTFNDGETSAYNITNTAGTLSVDDFYFLSTEGGGAGTYYAAAKVQSTGEDQEGSDWIGAPVPIPAAVWLFGSGLGLLGWIRRRKTV